MFLRYRQQLFVSLVAVAVSGYQRYQRYLASREVQLQGVRQEGPKFCLIKTKIQNRILNFTNDDEPSNTCQISKSHFEDEFLRVIYRHNLPARRWTSTNFHGGG